MILDSHSTLAGVVGASDGTAAVVLTAQWPPIVGDCGTKAWHCWLGEGIDDAASWIRGKSRDGADVAGQRVIQDF